MQLILSGNPNIATIQNVVCLANKHYENKIDRIFIIDNETSFKESGKETGKSLESARNEIIRGYIDNATIETTVIPKELLPKKIPEILSKQLQNYGCSEIIVDLTNGDKYISSTLYASASLSQIRNLFFLFVSRDKFGVLPENLSNEDYSIDIISPLENLESIGKYTYFDIVYYKNKVFDIEALFNNAKFDSSFLTNLFSFQIENSINNYFLEKYPESISNLGQLIEEVTLELPKRIKKFAHGTIKIESYKSFEDAINRLRIDFCEPLRKKQNKSLSEYEEKLKELQSIDRLIELVRTHRNISSHPYDYLRGQSEARLILNTSLYILEKLGEAKVFES